MNRQPSCCDFCGIPEVSHDYPTDREDVKWYACRDCAQLIALEDWDPLVERSLAAYFSLRVFTEDEKTALREQVHNFIERFRAVRLVAV